MAEEFDIKNVKVIGCPWCDSTPAMGGHDTGLYLYAECRNPRCEVQPSIAEHNDPDKSRSKIEMFQALVNKWNGRVKPDDQTAVIADYSGAFE